MQIASPEAGLVSLRKMSDCVVDLPPEYCQYHDNGCEFAQSCLNCHLPICVYDEPGGKQRLLKRRRAAEMARQFTREGKSIGELAQIFGVSRRTVQRALKIAFGDKPGKRSGDAQFHSEKPDKESRCGKEIHDSFKPPRFIQSDNYDEFRTAVTTKE
jgi:AraC-like DNA-binding protein